MSRMAVGREFQAAVPDTEKLWDPLTIHTATVATTERKVNKFGDIASEASEMEMDREHCFAKTVQIRYSRQISWRCLASVQLRKTAAKWWEMRRMQKMLWSIASNEPDREIQQQKNDRQLILMTSLLTCWNFHWFYSASARTPLLRFVVDLLYRLLSASLLYNKSIQQIEVSGVRV